jgi:hypothetical protein
MMYIKKEPKHAGCCRLAEILGDVSHDTVICRWTWRMPPWSRWRKFWASGRCSPLTATFTSIVCLGTTQLMGTTDRQLNEGCPLCLESCSPLRHHLEAFDILEAVHIEIAIKRKYPLLWLLSHRPRL